MARNALRDEPEPLVKLKTLLRNLGLTSAERKRVLELVDIHTAYLIEKYARTPLRGPGPRQRPKPGPKASYWPRDGAS